MKQGNKIYGVEKRLDDLKRGYDKKVLLIITTW